MGDYLSVASSIAPCPRPARDLGRGPAGCGVGRFGSGVAALRSRFARIGGRLRHGGAAYGVLLISLILSALAWYYVRHNVE